MDPTLTGTEAYLKPMPTAAGDGFGNVALAGDGQTLVVGAPAEDATKADSGAAYVFARQAGARAYLEASNPGLDDAFGAAVAISADGNVVAIAARSIVVTGERAERAVGLALSTPPNMYSARPTMALACALRSR